LAPEATNEPLLEDLWIRYAKRRGEGKGKRRRVEGGGEEEERVIINMVRSGLKKKWKKFNGRQISTDDKFS
jgi:hypothetical protein